MLNKPVLFIPANHIPKGMNFTYFLTIFDEKTKVGTCQTSLTASMNHVIELAIVNYSDEKESSRLIDLKKEKDFVFGCDAGLDKNLDLTYLIKVDSYIDHKPDNMGKFMHRDKTNTVTIRKDFFTQGSNYFVTCKVTAPDG